MPGIRKEIDYLKAVAIFLVVFYHAIYAAKLFLGNMFYICLTIGLEHVHVPLFMLIAGYLCHRQDVLLFYRKKINRILIPFIFMSFLKLLYNNLISAEHIHDGNIWEQIFDAYVCGGTYWFCYCLLVIFAIIPLVWGSRKRIWSLFAVLIAANIVLQFLQIELPKILQIGQVIYQLPFFLAGMLIYSYSIPEKINTSKRQYLLLLICLIVGGFCGYLRFGLDIYNRWHVDALFGLSVMYIIYFIVKRVKGRMADRILGSMGKYSLQIMFFDSFYRVVLYMAVYRIIDKGIAAAIIVTVLNIILSLLTCMVFRKIPVISKLCGL